MPRMTAQERKQRAAQRAAERQRLAEDRSVVIAVARHYELLVDDTKDDADYGKDGWPEPRAKEWMAANNERAALERTTRQSLQKMIAANGLAITGNLLDWLAHTIAEDRIGRREGVWWGIYEWKATDKPSIRLGPEQEMWGDSTPKT